MSERERENCLWFLLLTIVASALLCRASAVLEIAFAVRGREMHFVVTDGKSRYNYSMRDVANGRERLPRETISFPHLVPRRIGCKSLLRLLRAACTSFSAAVPFCFVREMAVYMHKCTLDFRACSRRVRIELVFCVRRAAR